MTLLAKNADQVDATLEAVRRVIPDLDRSELHLNIGHESSHYFDNVGYAANAGHAEVVRAIDEHRRANGTSVHPVRFLEDRYQKLIGTYYSTGRSPLPCTALSSSCFIDAYWNLYACSIWDQKVGNLREGDFDLRGLWESERRRALRAEIAAEQCPHCWTPCEAYPTILGNLVRSVSGRAGDAQRRPIENATHG